MPTPEPTDEETTIPLSPVPVNFRIGEASYGDDTLKVKLVAITAITPLGSQTYFISADQAMAIARFMLKTARDVQVWDQVMNPKLIIPNGGVE